MSEAQVYWIIFGVFAGIALVVFPVLFFITAPYGRHQKRAFGPALPSWAGWLVMESPAAIVMAALYGVGFRQTGWGGLALLLVWESHYVYRAFIYPFLRRSGRPMPVVIVLGGLFFNLINGYLNGRWIFGLAASRYDLAYLWHPPFIIGMLVFFAGVFINRQSDAILARLRASKTDTGYKIPHGGLYELVSSPNYFGELVEWIGWAIASWSPAGALFAVWTFANLGPRAVSNHRWYQREFPDYPKKRKAMIPFVM